MRIIAGMNKGMKLAAVAGRTSRPTTDFIKEAMFSAIRSCDGATALDLYAGTGSLGLEAISRGAVSARFVDMSNKSIVVLKANLAKCRAGYGCPARSRRGNRVRGRFPRR